MTKQLNNSSIKAALDFFGIKSNSILEKAAKSSLEKGESNNNPFIVKKEKQNISSNLEKSEKAKFILEKATPSERISYAKKLQKEAEIELEKAELEGKGNSKVLIKALGLDSFLEKAELLEKSNIALNKRLKDLERKLEKGGGEEKNSLELKKDIQASLEKSLGSELLEVKNLLQKMESNPIQKSYTSAVALEKFASPFSKGENGQQFNGQQKELSLSGSYQEIVGALSSRVDENKLQKGETDIFAEGLLAYEANKYLPSNVIVALNREGIFIKE